MSAENQPIRGAAPIIAAQVSPADALGSLVEALARVGRNWGYRAVLTFCDGSADAVLQSEGR